MEQNFFIFMSFGKYLRRIRTAAGLTQEELAEAITRRGHKTTLGSVSNIEREYYKKQDGSEAQPHKRFVIYAAESCGVSVDEALAEADYHSEDPFARAILAKIKALPKDRQELIWKQIIATLDIWNQGSNPIKDSPDVIVAVQNEGTIGRRSQAKRKAK